MAYLDTSILGSYYCRERLSAVVNAAVGELVEEAMISPLVEVEFCSLLSLKVRSGTMDRVSAKTVLSQFRTHLSEGLYRVVELSDREYKTAQGWLGGFDTPLRTLDALHLAVARGHRQEILTTDKALAQAAGQLGVKHRLLG